MRVFLSVLGLIVFLASAKFGYCLLMAERLTGGEFVSLLIAFAIIGMILAFATEVQEFSIAGNIVKLKEVKKDADKSINQLKAARTETFRFLLSLAKRHPGGFSDLGPIDRRLTDFWYLYEQIVSFGIAKELNNNLIEVAEELLKGQLNRISKNSDAVSNKYKGSSITPEPNQLTVECLDDGSVTASADRLGYGGDFEKYKQTLLSGVDEYRRLYELRAALKMKQC